MPTLAQIIQTQNQVVRQDPYFYKIVDILNLYSIMSGTGSNLNQTVKQARDGTLYRSVESIPKEYYDRQVYFLEPGRDKDTGYMYLRIVLL